MAVDLSAPHIGFVIAAYALSGVLLGLLIWTTVRSARRREAELKRLEEQSRKRRGPGGLN